MQQPASYHSNFDVKRFKRSRDERQDGTEVTRDVRNQLAVAPTAPSPFVPTLL